MRCDGRAAKTRPIGRRQRQHMPLRLDRATWKSPECLNGEARIQEQRDEQLVARAGLSEGVRQCGELFR